MAEGVIAGAAVGAVDGVIAGATAVGGPGLASGSYSGPICPQPASSRAAASANVATEKCMGRAPVGKAGDYTVR